MTTATMVTPASGTRPTAGVTRTLFAMQHVPNLVLSPEVRAHLNGQGQWEYYSERYVRGVGGVRDGLGLPGPQQRVEQLPQPRVERIPQAPRRDARQRWFVPAQYDDEIFEADETTDSEEAERHRLLLLCHPLSHLCSSTSHFLHSGLMPHIIADGRIKFARFANGWNEGWSPRFTHTRVT